MAVTLAMLPGDIPVILKSMVLIHMVVMILILGQVIITGATLV